ncbi:hypothetical protein KXW98_000840 [Aspergillus fumigatus]|uniref:Uncharacterized protein n=2 Tax=Aspergillus fumigatus TaxID=746128 RepID=Q4WT58_ASPFU|nr:conserved hypothetical protein [Aspergillus fumigatus Af293]KAH1298715.1 hypothetical protein KXX48_000050 [Aspergillus fumigatus]EAL90374.2 conserved hypothetical protein [Aspergillus fumigatus Af293]KAH1299120.1 hypothetical protein KXX30_003173 [Aspergillus fumigatus]KAH1320825.1 hypothetical protein KXX38_009112 [Aspergillus fumigatus]KAH1334011.1 hypothetical protein KXX47_003073 [Aspergillus fumigatus]
MDLDPTLMKSTNSTTGLRSFSVNTNAMNPATTRLSRRLLIFQEARNPSNMSEIVYLPVNKLGLPICGSGPELPSILELPLRILRAFTEIFNQPKYKGWAVLAAGPYHDTSEEGKYYAVVLEQTHSHSREEAASS